MEISKSAMIGGGKPTAAAEPPKQTTLDRVVDTVKENTKKGTLVGDHYIAVGAGALVGGTAAVAGVAKIADQVPAIANALEFAFVKNGRLLAGSVSLGAAAMLAEDAVQSFKEGSSVKAGAQTLGAAITGLGGVELVGRQYNIPGANRALSKTLDFAGDNAKAMVGGVAAVGGAAAIKKGVEEIRDGNTVKGAAIAAGGAVGVLGGAEMVGRQFDIPVMKEALTGPAKAVFTSKGGMAATGGAIGLTGAGAMADGVRRLTTEKGLVNDIIGAAEVTAGVTAVSGGTSLVGMAIGNEKLKQALPENLQLVGAAGALATAAVLGKHTVESVKENGITLGNTATGTGAALAALGGVELVADRFNIPGASSALNKGWKPVLGIGLGAASYKLGSNAVQEFREGNMGNAAGQAGLSFMTAAGSAAVLGDAFNIPVLNTFGKKSIEVIGEKVAEPIISFAVKNPWLTLGAVAVAGGAGAYAYYQDKDNK
ncbi:MAG: hypothetical protein ACO1RX_10020 [Candidatus Sericytochromatia bacterium]